MSNKWRFPATGVSSLVRMAQTHEQINYMTAPLSLPQKVDSLFRGCKGGMLDGVRGRKSETLAHAPWRQVTMSGSAKIFWAPEAGKVTHGKTACSRRLWRWSAFLLKAQPGCPAKAPISGDVRRVWVPWPVRALDILTRSGHRVTAPGPGLPTSVNCSRHTFPRWCYRTWRAIICVTCEAGIRVSCRSQNKVLYPASWTPQPTPHSSFQTHKAIFSSCSLLGNVEQGRGLSNLMERKHLILKIYLQISSQYLV